MITPLLCVKVDENLFRAEEKFSPTAKFFQDMNLW
jgi:hypothetical protein